MILPKRHIVTKHYLDYFWKEGIPYGLDALDNISSGISYKIVMDPYRKRISVEKYLDGLFKTSIYDSALLNFRHLNQMEQQSWQKIFVEETNTTSTCLIRDQNDRTLFLETYFFENNFCKKCNVTSPQGVLISIQLMKYKFLGEPENEVSLYDANEHLVLRKIYEADPETGEFTTLLKEFHNMNEVFSGKN